MGARILKVILSDRRISAMYTLEHGGCVTCPITWSEEEVPTLRGR